MFEKALKNQLYQAISQQEDKNLVVQSPLMTLTIEEMARELHICTKNARKLAKEDGFPAFTIGDKILISRIGLQRWIENQWNPTPA